MACSPSSVPGIFTNTFGRAALRWSSFAWVTVAAPSWASSGETSIDTNPSKPAVRWWTGAKTSAARTMSCRASSKSSSSPERPARASLPISASYAPVREMAPSRIVGFEVSPVTESCST
jgi:hypothetical protein